MRRLAMLGACAAAPWVLTPSPCGAQVMRTFSVSRPVAAERFLHVTLDFGGGTLVLGPAAGDELYGLTLRYDADRSAPIQQYDPRTGILRIGSEAVAGTGVRVSARSRSEQTARFFFSPTVPLALYANLGAGDAHLDLGGMTLTSLEVHGTATRATVDFSAPTHGPCKSATFAVGAAELDVRHLAQAGCDAVKVEGALGAVSLSFDGDWRRDATLTVDLAMGGLTLQLPAGIGVRIVGERFLAPFAAKGFVRTGDTWTTPGFDQASHKLRVDLKASMVQTTVRWMER